jgi:hypothetical protein
MSELQRGSALLGCTDYISNIITQVKEDEFGRSCSTNGSEEMHIGYWWES